MAKISNYPECPLEPQDVLDIHHRTGQLVDTKSTITYGNQIELGVGDVVLVHEDGVTSMGENYWMKSTHQRQFTITKPKTAYYGGSFFGCEHGALPREQYLMVISTSFKPMKTKTKRKALTFGGAKNKPRLIYPVANQRQSFTIKVTEAKVPQPSSGIEPASIYQGYDFFPGESFNATYDKDYFNHTEFYKVMDLANGSTNFGTSDIAHYLKIIEEELKGGGDNPRYITIEMDNGAYFHLTRKDALFDEIIEQILNRDEDYLGGFCSKFLSNAFEEDDPLRDVIWQLASTDQWGIIGNIVIEKGDILRMVVEYCKQRAVRNNISEGEALMELYGEIENTYDGVAYVYRDWVLVQH